ncbi:MAG: dolichol-phosphate mannosyltransferase, partial [Bradyrhizobium sp.]|nr:dolichol-phosphate mannosyltransferase [Bradyrhizobium sp.]
GVWWLIRRKKPTPVVTEVPGVTDATDVTKVK